MHCLSLPTLSWLPKHYTFHKPHNPLTHLLQTLPPLLVKPTCTAVASTAFFFVLLQLNPNKAAAEPIPPPPDSAVSETLSNDENECDIGEQPSDGDALKSLLHDNIKARKMDEAIRVLDGLMELEPEEFEWVLLKAHLYIRQGKHELASNEFEHVLRIDPFNVEAYRGLLMAISELNGPTVDLLKRIENSVKVCEEEKRDSDVRDLKLLIAQIKVIGGDLSAALQVYQELVKEEPKDFRPYLCQGIVYTMLKKKDEAEKQFEKYRTLVPENHPRKDYFENSTKIFSRKLRRKVGAES